MDAPNGKLTELPNIRPINPLDEQDQEIEDPVALFFKREDAEKLLQLFPSWKNYPFSLNDLLNLFNAASGTEDHDEELIKTEVENENLPPQYEENNNVITLEKQSQEKEDEQSVEKQSGIEQSLVDQNTNVDQHSEENAVSEQTKDLEEQPQDKDHVDEKDKDLKQQPEMKQNIVDENKDTQRRPEKDTDVVEHPQEKSNIVEQNKDKEHPPQEMKEMTEQNKNTITVNQQQEKKEDIAKENNALKQQQEMNESTALPNKVAFEFNELPKTTAPEPTIDAKSTNEEQLSPKQKLEVTSPPATPKKIRFEVSKIQTNDKIQLDSMKKEETKKNIKSLAKLDCRRWPALSKDDGEPIYWSMLTVSTIPQFPSISFFTFDAESYKADMKYFWQEQIFKWKRDPILKKFFPLWALHFEKSLEAANLLTMLKTNVSDIDQSEGLQRFAAEEANFIAWILIEIFENLFVLSMPVPHNWEIIKRKVFSTPPLHVANNFLINFKLNQATKEHHIRLWIEKLEALHRIANEPPFPDSVIKSALLDTIEKVYGEEYKVMVWEYRKPDVSLDKLIQRMDLMSFLFLTNVIREKRISGPPAGRSRFNQDIHTYLPPTSPPQPVHDEPPSEPPADSLVPEDTEETEYYL
ncbi:hypothetical protein NCAS_0C02670 [Naumovozyma castellii]|uniref:Uncharacterized protein n=1 Tax=Naumovozyma castellii TaxID=27288 RepID=G0VCP7_NAUCA|nr:hypothetical protein NCAS_0C02670 [Naumovozyma castellii CBS 4309]CCC69257.1 hypothetical protein NCAS_0C02670 [Naumovozyma castellii CBS 4309]